MTPRYRTLFFILVSLVTTSCSTAYFNTMEKFGIHKRDLLVSRVESARDSQKDAQKEFKSALAAFKEVTNFDGGNLERTYDKLKRELDDSEAAAQSVRDRIDSVDSVASALFKEWRKELGQYENRSLKETSARELKQTEARYAQLLAAMKQAERKLNPVLQPFRDQVLFLKHNLNAKAIGSLSSELSAVQNTIDSLVRDLQISIDEADRFINQMGNE